jgi:CubicO group peptidase (beta-lactamase class C family)
MRSFLGFLGLLLSLCGNIARADQVDNIVRAEMERQHIPGMSVAVVREGKIVREAGYGFANVELCAPAKPETIYQSGSVGKQFTAALVMLLVEDGEIALDGPVSKYLPDVSENWSKITVRHLLTHTSGMGDPFDKLDMRKDYTEDEILKVVGTIPVKFQPGQRWEYSNTGYEVLGFLCSKVGGKFYGDQLMERIFKPIGMTTARIISERDIVPNRAAGYEWVTGELKNQSWVSPSLNTTADGSLYVTVRDLAAWDAVLYGDKLLKPSSSDAIWTPVKLNDGKTHPYGFGWTLSPVNGHRCFSHNGLWQGFSAHIARYVDDKLTVIVLTNLAEANAGKIGRQIAADYVPALAESVASNPELGLEDLSPVSAIQGWGQLQLGKSVSGQPISIAGRHFAHGLGTHAPSELVYDLEGEYERFEAWVGLDDFMKDHTEGSIVFQVFGDGRTLFESGVMHVGDAAKQVNVSVAGVSELKLIVTDAGDGKDCDHADWADAVLIGKKATNTERPQSKYEIKSAGIVLQLDAQGGVAGCKVGEKKMDWPLVGGTRLGGCRAMGNVKVEQLAEGDYRFVRKLGDGQGHACTLSERFRPTKDSIRWEVEIVSDNEPWSTAISTRLKHQATPEMRFWTAWSDPEHDSAGWRDPRVLMPFTNTRWPYSNLTEPSPVRGDFIPLPLATVALPSSDAALSLVLSPEDTLLEMWLATDKTGTVQFTRQKHRLGKGQPVRFAMDLVAHEADWRGGLRWLVSRYPQYFDPPNAKADEMAGCGAYSGEENPIDVAKFKKMAFRINWKLSDDFAYMGMFIPPVKDANETWERSCDEAAPPGKGRMISCRQMNDYARYMRENGFYVLNYFNVTEFGKRINGRVVPAEKANDPELWKDPSAFLKLKLPHAAFVPYIPTFYGAVIVDPGDPAFQEFILEQAEKHNRLLPDTSGICIDRMDWLLLYNLRADDGVSWVEGKPARAGTESWKSLMAKLAPLMHKADKVVFGNPMIMRIDLMHELDGFYSEHGEWGPGLNAMAMVAMRKPALTWTCMWWDEPRYDLKPDPDSFFQRHLLMGVYPTAPYPFNNHALRPHLQTDRHYLAYGPLMDAMRGKKWVLEPHCVETSTPEVKVNLFQVPGGYAVPVTFGGNAKEAVVYVRNVSGLENVRCEALHPGVEKPLSISSTFKNGTLELHVPLYRGCAMVKTVRE